MRSGFKFNDKHTGEFEGVVVRTKDRPIFPSVKEMVHSAAEMDGEYDFTEATGHEYFNTRTFHIEFAVTADNLQALQKKLTALSRWFRGRGTLIFDDIPTVKWSVRVVDNVSYMPENDGHKALLEVTYKAMPFSELLWDVIEGPCLDDGIVLDSDYPLETEHYFTFRGAGTYINVPNVGDAYIKPVITVTGAKAPFIIGCDGKNIEVNCSGNFVIDCERELVYSGTTSLMPYVKGDFPELEPGDKNALFISDNSIVQLNYTPKFLYDGDFDGTLWGDEDD